MDPPMMQTTSAVWRPSQMRHQSDRFLFPGGVGDAGLGGLISRGGGSVAAWNGAGPDIPSSPWSGRVRGSTRLATTAYNTIWSSSRGKRFARTVEAHGLSVTP